MNKLCIADRDSLSLSIWLIVQAANAEALLGSSSAQDGHYQAAQSSHDQVPGNAKVNERVVEKWKEISREELHRFVDGVTVRSRKETTKL